MVLWIHRYNAKNDRAMNLFSFERKLLFATQAGLSLLLVTPLLFFHGFTHPHSSTQSYAILAISEVIFVCFVWLACLFPRWRPAWTRLDKVFFFFVSVLFVALLVGEDSFFSFWSSMDRTTGGLMWAHLVMVYVVARGVLRRFGDWVIFFSISLLVSLISSLIHLLSLAGIDLLGSSAGGSTFGNSTYFAVYLLLNVFFALFVFTQTNVRSRKILAGVSIVVFCVTLFLTAAIAAKISLLGGLLFFFALSALSIGHKTWIRFLGRTVVILLLVGGGFVGAMAFQSDSVVRQELIEISSSARFALWNMAWQGIQEKPLLGWGLENYRLVSYAYFDPCFGSPACGEEIWFDRAHNKILDVWVESGLVGLVAYLGIFFVAFLSLWQARLASGRAHYAFAVLVSALAAYFVHNLTALETSIILLFWVVLLACASAASKSDTFFAADIPHVPNRPIVKFVPSIITSLLLVSIFFFVIQPAQANLAVRRAIFADEPDKRREAYDIATSVSPVGIDQRRVWLADDTVKTIWQGIPAGMELPQGLEDELTDAKTRLEDTLARSPGDLRSRIALGFVYQTEGGFLGNVSSYEKAILILEEGLRQSPNHPVVRRALAGVYLDQERKEEGLVLLKTLIELSPKSVSAYGYYLVALRLAGDQELFEATALQALILFPSLSDDVEQLRRGDAQVNRQALLNLFH